MLKYLRNILTILRYYVNLKVRTLKNIYQRFFYFLSVVVKPTSYGECVKKRGLSLLQAPGNDLVAANALAVSGAQLILFTTGRGTPFGCPVPTAKISSNSALANRKKAWIDFNAGTLLENKTMPDLTDEFLNYVLKLASGEIKAKAETLDKHELAIFKDGVTL